MRNHASILKKTVFFTALIVTFVMAVLPTGVPLLEINDKILHATTFMFLFFLMDKAYERMPHGAMSAYLMAYGVFIEFVQFFLPYREFSSLDMAANGAGLCAYYFLRRGYVSYRATP